MTDPRSTSRGSATSARTKTFRSDPDPLDVSDGVPVVPGTLARKLLANVSGLTLRRLEELPLDVTQGIHRAWNRGYAVGESIGRHERDNLIRRIAVVAGSIGLLVGVLIGSIR